MKGTPMPTLPWTAGPATPVSTTDSIVMASRFRVRRHRDVLPFFLDAMRVFALARRSRGNVGVTLRARPLRKEFWTLSQWSEQAALNEMVRTEPHASIMVRQREVMAESAFRFWTAPAPERPTWADAERRVTEAPA
jgi:hypothetical protein